MIIKQYSNDNLIMNKWINNLLEVRKSNCTNGELVSPTCIKYVKVLQILYWISYVICNCIAQTSVYKSL